MKNKINNITRTGMILGFTAITAMSMALLARAGNNLAPEQSVASHKPPHGGGGGPTSLPYPTASTVSQLIADINYANSAGGAITINLASGTTFDLTSANNTTDGNNGFPVIGGTKAVALTITGNGDTIERIQVIGKHGTVNYFRLFDVAVGSSLTLDKVTVKGGNGSIFNHGTLNVIDGSSVSGNGEAIYNNGGTVTVSDSTLSDNGCGIYNNGGMVTVGGSTLSGNSGAIYNNASGTVTINASTLSDNHIFASVPGGSGGAVYNSGGSVTINNSALSGNSAEYGGAVYNVGGIVSISNHSLFASNTAFFFFYDGRGGFGGAIYTSGGAVTIDDTSVTNNTSDMFGGGIYIDAGATVTINNSSVSGNSVSGNNYNSYSFGGGIYNAGTTTVQNSSSITGNAPDDVENYGMLYLDGTSTIDILNGTSVIPI